MRCESNIFEKNLLFRNSLKSFIPKKNCLCVLCDDVNSEHTQKN